MIISLAAWLIASAAGSAAARGLYQHGTASYWGVLLVAFQGLVLRPRGVPYLRWVVWGAGGWVVGALFGAQMISSFIRALLAAAPNASVLPSDLPQRAVVFGILGAAEFVVLRPHLPQALLWVALNVLAGVVMTFVESPIRVLLFAPVETVSGVAAAEAAVGAAIGALYGAITAPLVARVRPAR